jgi:hypothetical protein
MTKKNQEKRKKKGTHDEDKHRETENIGVHMTKKNTEKLIT